MTNSESREVGRPEPDDSYNPEDDGWIQLSQLNGLCPDCSYSITTKEIWMLPCDFHEKAIKDCAR